MACRLVKWLIPPDGLSYRHRCSELARVSIMLGAPKSRPRAKLLHWHEVVVSDDVRYGSILFLVGRDRFHQGHQLTLHGLVLDLAVGA